MALKVHLLDITGDGVDLPEKLTFAPGAFIVCPSYRPTRADTWGSAEKRGLLVREMSCSVTVTPQVRRLSSWAAA